MMKNNSLGTSGLKVPELCLGTMTFGEADEDSFMHNVGTSKEDSFAIMNRALELGINFWDTADIYGQDGLSERIIGQWFASTGKRDDVLLATKFRFRTDEGPNGAGAARFHIVRAVEDSLKRLQTDRIDLYQIHMQDSSVPEEETLRALDDLVRAGKVLYIGCSNYAAYRLVDSLWTSKTRLLERFVSAQMQYSLMERDIEREHVPVCKKFGLGVLPWSPLAAGFLSGKFERNKDVPEDSRLAKWSDRFGRYDNDNGWQIVETVKEMARKLDVTPAQVSLAWLLHQPWVSSVIIGARKLSQLEENARATEIELSQELLQQLNEVSAPYLGYPYDFIQRVEGGW